MMKQLFILLGLSASLATYGRGGTTLTINGGIQTTMLTSAHAAWFEPGLGYGFAATVRKPLIKGFFAGVEIGVAQMRHELRKLTAGFASYDDISSRNCVVGQPSMHIGLQGGYRIRIWQSELSLAAQLAYVNNAVWINEDPERDDNIFYEQTTGIRYGAKLEYTFRVNKYLYAGMYVNPLFYTVYSDTEKWGKQTYRFAGTGTGLSLRFRL